METEKLFVFFFYCKKYNKTNIRLSKFFKSNKVVLKARVKFLIKNKSTKQFFNNKKIVFIYFLYKIERFYIRLRDRNESEKRRILLHSIRTPIQLV
jgi:hypothetical protein